MSLPPLVPTEKSQCGWYSTQSLLDSKFREEFRSQNKPTIEKITKVVEEILPDTFDETQLASIKSETNLMNAFAKVNTFQELEWITRNVKEDISFWGQRYVYSSVYKEGTLQIDELALKTIDLVNANWEFNQEERAFGKKIAAKIIQLYASNDSREVNFITKIFCSIRDFINNWPHFSHKETTRDDWEGNYYESFSPYSGQWIHGSISSGVKNRFEKYSYNQFKKVFGFAPDFDSNSTFTLKEYNEKKLAEFEKAQKAVQKAFQAAEDAYVKLHRNSFPS